MAKTILVVEDEVVQREGLATILRQHGYNVVTAPNADEGLAVLRSAPPDLVLLDMILPPGGHDGWHLLNERKRDPVLATIPVALTTGIGNASDEWAAGLGACC